MSRSVAFDPAFDGAGAQPGLEVWRIEALKPVKIEQFTSELYSGDSYILLHTKKAPKSNSLDYDLFFWLGKDSSQDEQGIAAYKTVELDDSLGGKPIQYRETQEHESSLFLSLFKPLGVRYLDGGVDSGFRKVERDKYDPRLLHLKGTRNVRVAQVALSSNSLNHGDVFILDAGLTIFQWNGASANKFEKAKGLDICTKIKNEERGGRASLIVLHDGEDDSSEEAEAFWSTLGGKGAIAAADDQDAAAEKLANVCKLFRISDASGQLEITLVSEKPEQGMLDTNDCFLVQSPSEIFVWVGKGSTKEEKASGMKYASNFLKQENLPEWTPVSRLVEGAETPLFKSKFVSWKDKNTVTTVDFSKRVSGNKVAGKREQKAIDVDAMASGSLSKKEDEKMFDDGTGKLQVFRIESMEMSPIPAEQYGRFYSGDSYIIQYTYLKSGREQNVIYFWQGRDSSQDEKAASAFLARALDERCAQATQVRVVEGKEPNHFLTLFRGKFVTFLGGTPSGFKNVSEASEEFSADKTALFRIKGTSSLNTKAVEVAAATASLNSGDSFVLQTAAALYLWYGQGSSDEERGFALSVANSLKGSRPIVEVEETEEPAEFWTALGGEGEYTKVVTSDDAVHEPRLFHCSNAAGVFEVEEIYNFTQDDLMDDDVMILDAHSEVFVWVGSGSNDEEKRMANEVVQNYVQKAAAQDGRGECSIVRVDAGHEPVIFTGHFLSWTPKPAGFVDPYQARLAKHRSESESSKSSPSFNVALKKVEKKPEAAAAVSTPTPASPAPAPAPSPAKAAPAPAASSDPSFSTGGQVYTYAQLKSGVEAFPEGINPSIREKYLSDAEFSTVFGMTKAEFEKMPGWKQQTKKKEVKLW